MLVKRDPWNAIEFFYEPEKEFLYYDDEEELPGLIEKISSNWNDYKHIVDNAYDKAMKNFTTEAVLRKMIEDAAK
jgi:spore maturation protein CgeB